MIRVVSCSAAETKKIAEQLARRLQGGEVLALRGDLGSGKTTFIKGLAQGLGIKAKITSPGFILIKPYPVNRNGLGSFYHLDLLRLKSRRELFELGLPEILRDQTSIVAIEWPERARNFLPKNTIYLKFQTSAAAKQRVIKLWPEKSF